MVTRGLVVACMSAPLLRLSEPGILSVGLRPTLSIEISSYGAGWVGWPGWLSRNPPSTMTRSPAATISTSSQWRYHQCRMVRLSVYARWSSWFSIGPPACAPLRPSCSGELQFREAGSARPENTLEVGGGVAECAARSDHGDSSESPAAKR